MNDKEYIELLELLLINGVTLADAIEQLKDSRRELYGC